jgi:protein-S-isoprenylcysteine O-methyltransferase Ste14
LATAFGLRTWVQYRRTGDYGVRGLSGQTSSIGRLCSALLIVGVVLAGAAPIAGLVTLEQRPAVVDIPWLGGAGLTLSLLDIAITLVSQYQMGDSWRVGVDFGETPLITVGLFGIVRNPIFNGMVFAAAGLLMMVPNLLSGIAFVSLFVGLQMQVRWIEEPHLARIHGTTYLSYARMVGRFLPGVGRLT